MFFVEFIIENYFYLCLLISISKKYKFNFYKILLNIFVLRRGIVIDKGDFCLEFFFLFVFFRMFVIVFFNSVKLLCCG